MSTTYPNAPGHRGDTASMLAAKYVAPGAKTIREKVESMFNRGWRGTIPQAAQILGIAYHSVQPRFSELLAQGKIRKIHLVRGPNNDHSIWVWGPSE